MTKPKPKLTRRQYKFRNIYLDLAEKREEIKKTPLEKLVQTYFDELYFGVIPLSTFNNLVEQSRLTNHMNVEEINAVVDTAHSLPSIAEYYPLNQKKAFKKHEPSIDDDEFD